MHVCNLLQLAEFSLVALGGTFDIIHKGHIVLLERAFAVSDIVVIGLASDELVRRKAKAIMNGYKQRLQNLTDTISSTFPDSAYQISKLDDDFGPAVLQEGIEALIVSEETHDKGDILNAKRTTKGLSPVKIITVPMLQAADGIRISSTRIRNSEIDVDGNMKNN